MSSEAWILIAVVAALLVVALVAGFVLYKRRRVTLTPPTAEKEVTDRSGGYSASGGFNFSQGGTATATRPEPAPIERTDTEGQPHIGDDAAIPRDAPRRGITNVPLPEGDVDSATAESATATAESDAAVESDTPVESDTAAVESDTAAVESDTAAVESAAAPADTPPGNSATTASVDPATSVPTDSAATPADSGTASAQDGAAATAMPADGAAATAMPADGAAATAMPADGAAAADTDSAHDGAAATAEPTDSPSAAAPTGTASETAPVETPEPTAADAATTPALDEIEPTAGRLVRLRGRLSRSQNAVGKSLLGLLGGGDLDDDSWEDVEDTLVLADLGTASTAAVVERLREEMAARSVRNTEQARTVLREVLIEALRPELDRSIRALPHDDHPSILLVVGVNGTGKTTTTGKLARVLVADGRRVLLGAADTFRAAAADQLQTWGERVGADTIRGKEGADPAAVAFDAVAAGIDRGVDVVMIDTAGRLHTKTGLMDELGKVKRVVEKKAKVDEVLLVLDSTVGQNGLMQARVFAEVVDITGVVLTKLDGTAKGGIVFQVQHELGVPVKLVGLGEGADDLAPFEPGAFVDALLGLNE
ncbi:signal recognition particle-docking protein FtsY [Nocardia sp. NBC_00565]|nr:signal recognition particle-docking protein FtsY [Nocardia sp. NBC_00565]WUB99985.1 signal recognition particle-docking protein FtsY [Nocardia sp. NBC_00565]